MSRTSGGPRVRGGISARWWLVALVVPTVLMLVALVTQRDGVERSLERQVNAELAGVGLTNAAATVDGRDITVKVPTGVNPQRVRATLQKVPGVRQVSVPAGGR